MAANVGESVRPICDGCQNTISSVVLLSQSISNVLQFLYNHGVLPTTKVCPKCGNMMTLNEERSFFRCHKRKIIINSHRKKVSVQCSKSIAHFEGTFLEKSKLPVSKVVMISAFWCLLPPPRLMLMTHELDIAYTTAIDWSGYLRDVCVQYFYKESKPIGGPGTIVEVDESKIGRCKNNRGKKSAGNWVFGGIQRDSKAVFVIPVEKRGHDTLLPIIRQYILPGTTIVSDCWKAYKCLQNEGYQHLTVNHRYNFVDPETGAHTQNIRRMWREVQSVIPKFGRINPNINGYLAEFLFKRKYSDYKSRIHHLWSMISEVYNDKDRNNIEEDGSESIEDLSDD